MYPGVSPGAPRIYVRTYVCVCVFIILVVSDLINYESFHCIHYIMIINPQKHFFVSVEYSMFTVITN